MSTAFERLDSDGLRVALVHDWLTGMRGGEKVLQEIASRFPDSPIFTLFHLPGSVSDALESHPIYTSSLQRAPLLARHYRSYLPLFPGAIERFDLSSFDLVVSSSHCVAKGVKTTGPHLCYCHTPVRYAWDQMETYFPKSSGPIGMVRSHLLKRLRRWDQRTADRVHRYVANSHFVAGRIKRYYDREATVIAPPIDTSYFALPAPDTHRADYFVSVAALSPYKRHDVAIAAANTLGLELLIVGEGPDRKRLEQLAGPTVQFTGRVDDERLRELYQTARALVQPGIEDFGMAPVEALACGTPIVAAGEGGVLDIVRDGLEGVLYEPHQDAALVAALQRFEHLSFDRGRLAQRAEEFSLAHFHERFAREIQATLER